MDTEPEDICEQLWPVIHEADGDLDRLERALERLSRGALGRFCWAYEQAAANLYREELWSHVDADVSEDGLQDIVNSVVGQGREAYEAALEDYTTMPRSVSAHQPTANFLGVAHRLYRKRYGGPVPDRDLAG